MWECNVERERLRNRSCSGKKYMGNIQHSCTTRFVHLHRLVTNIYLDLRFLRIPAEGICIKSSSVRLIFDLELFTSKPFICLIDEHLLSAVRVEVLCLKICVPPSTRDGKLTSMRYTTRDPCGHAPRNQLFSRSFYGRGEEEVWRMAWPILGLTLLVPDKRNTSIAASSDFSA